MVPVIENSVVVFFLCVVRKLDNDVLLLVESLQLNQKEKEKQEREREKILIERFECHSSFTHVEPFGFNYFIAGARD